MNKETKFKVGDKAHKPKGYKFPCTIVGVFETIAGEVRVIGEMDEYGLLHIFNENQLEHYGKDEPDLLNEAYENYKKEIIRQRELQKEEVNRLRSQRKRLKVDLIKLLSKEEFIDKCKTNKEFSEKWGLKIEERELSLEERYKIALPIWKEKYGLLANMMVPTNVDNTPYNIPTKLITVTYNDKTIESYE
jgi:hypothetical protein